MLLAWLDVNITFCPSGNVVGPLATTNGASGSGFTVRFNVAVESQPAALVKCMLYVPDALSSTPFQFYGTRFAPPETSVVLLVAEATTRLSIAVESHPAAFVEWKLYEPAT